MKNAIIYGCGLTGEKVYEQCKTKYNVIGFSDSNENKWGGYVELKDGNRIEIIPPAQIKDTNYEVVFVGSIFIDDDFINQMSKNNDIPIDRISKEFITASEIVVGVKAREIFLKNQAVLLNDNVGAVAEGGVYQGQFARCINTCFPDKTLHLFDTFEGFDERDVEFERENEYSNSKYNKGYFKPNVTLDQMLDSMPNKERVVIHKGYFPESVENDTKLEKERFVFVNLDFDLYKPTLAGLEYFWPKMVGGGIILIHDYFSEAFAGPKDAVDKFAKENNINKFAIGDGISIAIQKQ